MARERVDWGTFISWAARVTCSVRATPAKYARRGASTFDISAMSSVSLDGDSRAVNCVDAPWERL
ncbi:hypothetical protein SVIOM74S_10565 [Streptomyces violarus]